MRHTGRCYQFAFVCFSRSEIWFVRPRHVGVLARVPLDVFGASLFRPVGGVTSTTSTSTTSISHGRGPRRREDAFVLDREPELQVLAPIFRVHPLGDVMLLGVACEPLFGGFGIK